MLAGLFTWWRQITCLAVEPDDLEGDKKGDLGLETIFVEPESAPLPPVTQKPEIPWSELMKLHQTPREESWPPKPRLGRRISMMKAQWETAMNGQDWEEYNAALKTPPGQERTTELKNLLIKK